MSSTGRGSPSCCARASASPGPRCATRRAGRRSPSRARHVLLAAGAWTDELRAGSRPQFASTMRPSKGIHITVARERDPDVDRRAGAHREERAVHHPDTDAGWLIGDTDTPWPLRPRRPRGQRRRHRLPAGQGQRAAGATPLTPRRRARGVRRAAPARRRGRRRRHHPAQPPPRRRGPGARADHDRRGQVHDLPGDGRRRDRRRRAGVPRPGARRARTHIPLCGADRFAAARAQRAELRRERWAPTPPA